MLALMLAAAIDEPPALRGDPAPPPHVYLHPPAEGCDSRAPGDEVVVCAERDGDKRDRLQPIDDDRFASKPLEAKTKLGSGTAALAGAAASVGGWPSNRIMLAIKFPF